MTIAVFISVICHVVIGGIYNYCLPLPILIPLAIRKQLSCSCFFTWGVTQTFIPLHLHGLGCCSFPLTLVTGHGNTKRHTKGSPIF